jgi:hypothetical protein
MSGNEAAFTNTTEVRDPSGEIVVSIELNDVCYKCQGKLCWCAFHSVGKYQFPVGLVSNSGFAVGVAYMRFGRSMFASRNNLMSICIPSSVETLCKSCFYEWNSLLTLTFESNSKLSYIQRYAFYGCSSLSSICIPSSLRTVFREYQQLLNVDDSDDPVRSEKSRNGDSLESVTVATDKPN